MILSLKFHPQAWVNNYAIEADPEGPQEWEAEWDGNAPIPDDNSFESDELRFLSSPQWVREWRGPFYVEILNRDELSSSIPGAPSAP